MIDRLKRLFRAGVTQPVVTVASMSQEEREAFLGNRVVRFANHALLDWTTDGAGDFFTDGHTVRLFLEPPAVSVYGTEPFHVAETVVKVFSDLREVSGEARVRVASLDDAGAIHDLGRAVADTIVGLVVVAEGRDYVPKEEPPVSAGRAPQPSPARRIGEVLAEHHLSHWVQAARQLTPTQACEPPTPPYQLPRRDDVYAFAEEAPWYADHLLARWQEHPEELPNGPLTDVLVQVTVRSHDGGTHCEVVPEAARAGIERVVSEVGPPPAGLVVTEWILVAVDQMG